MSKVFTFSKLSKMGDPDETYGQSYWAEVNEQLEPVMFNLVNQEVTENDTITAETIELKTSKKGTDYHRLKKVKVVDGSTASPQALAVTREAAGYSGSDRTIAAQLDRIESKIDKLLGVEPELDQAIIDDMPPDFLQ